MYITEQKNVNSASFTARAKNIAALMLGGLLASSLTLASAARYKGGFVHGEKATGLGKGFLSWIDNQIWLGDF